MTLPIETDRLVLRPARPDDDVALHAVLGDPEVGRWLGGPKTLDEVRVHIESQRQLQVRAGFSMWAVVEWECGQVIGDTGLQPLDGGPEVEIGWRLRRDRWGRGYATEAARAALAFGFEEAGLEAIVAVARPDNHASIRVMEKLGMACDGRAVYYGHDVVKYAARRAAIVLSRGRETGSDSRSAE